MFAFGHDVTNSIPLITEEKITIATGDRQTDMTIIHWKRLSDHKEHRKCQ